MIFNWFWATVSNEINQSVFDFFSFGHIAMGIVTFAILSLISTLRNLMDPRNFLVKNSHWIAFLLGTIIFGIFWEIVENTFLYDWGLKYLNRRDSIINAVFDIILVGIGALICYGFAYLLYVKVKKCQFPWFYLFNSLSFILFYLIYLGLEF